MKDCSCIFTYAEDFGDRSYAVQEKSLLVRWIESEAQSISSRNHKLDRKDFDANFGLCLRWLVSSLEEAVEHIEAHSTHHSVPIATEESAAATSQSRWIAQQLYVLQPALDGGQVALAANGYFSQNFMPEVLWG